MCEGERGSSSGSSRQLENSGVYYSGVEIVVEVYTLCKLSLYHYTIHMYTYTYIRLCLYELKRVGVAGMVRVLALPSGGSWIEPRP